MDGHKRNTNIKEDHRDRMAGGKKIWRDLVVDEDEEQTSQIVKSERNIGELGGEEGGEGGGGGSKKDRRKKIKEE